MFLFSKTRGRASRPQTPDLLPTSIHEAESEVSPDSPKIVMEQQARSPRERRSKTFVKSFRSLRKTRTPVSAMSKAFESLSKVDMTDAEDMKRLYPEYDSNNPDHNPDIPQKEEDVVTGSTRGSLRALSMSKVPSLRKRSRSTQRTPSPKRSFFRESTSNFLDTGAKTLRGWASYLHKRSSSTEVPEGLDTLNVPRSSPIPIPTSAPTLAPLELSSTPFEITENVPLTARPTSPPILNRIHIEQRTFNENRLSVAKVRWRGRSQDEQVDGLTGKLLATEKDCQLDKPDDPFDDTVTGISPASTSSLDNDGIKSVGQDQATAKQSSLKVVNYNPLTDALHTASDSDDSTKEIEFLRRAPATRRRTSPVRARTTEEALERLEEDVQLSDSDSAVESIHQRDSDIMPDVWASKPTHEEIRTRFKRSKHSSTEYKAMFSDSEPHPLTLHPRPLSLRTKPADITAEQEISRVIRKTDKSSDNESPSLFGDVSSAGTPSTRKFRFANTHSRSVSPEHIPLPGIIDLDHKVNTMAQDGSNLILQNRFAILADLRQSESSSEAASQQELNLSCKCNPCECDGCGCGDVLSPERTHRQCLRSELSTISDLSEEERQCVGIV